MSALERLLSTFRDVTKNDKDFDGIAEEAAEELSSIIAGNIEKIAFLLDGNEIYGENGVIVMTEKRYNHLIAIEGIASDVNVWLKKDVGLWGTAHQRTLEAALKGEA